MIFWKNILLRDKKYSLKNLVSTEIVLNEHHHFMSKTG